VAERAVDRRAGDARWRPILDQGLASFRSRFWNDAGGCFHDVVDADHVPGRVDRSFRPNQIFAIGGLPLALLEESARDAWSTGSRPACSLPRVCGR